MELFTVAESQLMPGDVGGTRVSLVFLRLTATTLSTGELTTSYLSNISLTLDLQADKGNFPWSLRTVDHPVDFGSRTLGIVDYKAYYLGNPDVQVGDRAVICAAPVEVVEVLRLGAEYTELHLTYVRGRNT